MGLPLLVQVPALGVFTKSLELGKFAESGKLSNGSTLSFAKIYPMDAVFDTPEDVPPEVPFPSVFMHVCERVRCDGPEEVPPKCCFALCLFARAGVCLHAVVTARRRSCPRYCFALCLCTFGCVSSCFSDSPEEVLPEILLPFFCMHVGAEACACISEYARAAMSVGALGGVI